MSKEIKCLLVIIEQEVEITTAYILRVFCYKLGAIG